LVSRSIRAGILLAALVTLASSCSSLDGVGDRGGGGPVLVVVPPTLKLTREDGIPARHESAIELDAARGEGESAQLLLFAPGKPILDARCEAGELVGPDGFTIDPEVGLLGYVPVTKPSLVGFHRFASFPDPVLPNASFSVQAGRNQALLYTVHVPRDAPAGRYEGRVIIAIDGVRRALTASLTVHDVTLPVTSFLATSINFREESERDERYYGKAWTDSMSEDLPRLGLRFRFSSRVHLPLAAVFGSTADGKVGPDWKAFDAEVERWLSAGITRFELDPGFGMELEPAEIDRRFGSLLDAIEAHLREKNWQHYFYFYLFDEPSRRDMPGFRARLAVVRAHAPSIPVVLTYGTTMAGQKELAGEIGIWVPNIHQFDPNFTATRKALGEEVWVYTCVANAFRPYPDNFRIDWYGTAHVALGWWLFTHGVQGFLYWGTDVWRSDPWKDAATFPWTNGDGMLFYPAPDRKSMPLASLRAHLMRDSFEDYDLLTMLRIKTATEGSVSPEEVALLKGAGLVGAGSRFSTDDWAYVEAHRRILALLAGEI